ncbi:class I SAM-dependent methyltransferase [Brochothrix thermosphacta]|uniref:class I SAM-dependent methyltransferase n=1 Tax=Brochothrix thermosphacta TaxID=2756 RepID=UPI003F98C16B
MNELFGYLKNNNLYSSFEEGKDSIWTSDKFSDFVMASYLNPLIPGGGKTEDEIESYINWVKINAIDEAKILDIGCGPGIYCEKLSSLGYRVTGVDISSKAILYAKDQTNQKQSNIDYICDDIFKVEFDNKFNVIIILYKTFATFSKEKRLSLLSKINKLLDKGGGITFRCSFDRRI